MTLADDAATGSAGREAVAIAPGVGSAHVVFPDYQRDLAATLAEIERRGWGYAVGNVGGPWAQVWIRLDGYLGSDFVTTGTTIANAACAALLTALENSDD